MTQRADKFTIRTKKIEKYSDFTNNLGLNPITGFLAKVSDEESIKQSIKNLLYTQRTERPYNSFIGSRLRHLLFEPVDDVTEQSLRKEITETLNNNEPRVKLVEIIIKALNNEYNITIIYNILNIPNEAFSLNLTFKRVR